MTARFARCAAAVSAVALTFAVGACQGGDGDSKADVAAVSMSGNLTRDTFVDRMGAAQREASTGSFTMDIVASGQANVATGQFLLGGGAKDSAVALQMEDKSSGLGVLDLRLVDAALYMNFGELTGGKFTKLPIDGSGDAATQQLVELVNQVNPAAQIKQFEAALKSFKQTGVAKTIDGVKALPYVVVLDTSKIDGAAKLAEGASQKLPKALTYTMWVGPDDLPRRVEAKVVAMDFTLNYTNWSKPVTIEAPKV